MEHIEKQLEEYLNSKYTNTSKSYQPKNPLELVNLLLYDVVIADKKYLSDVEGIVGELVETAKIHSHTDSDLLNEYNDIDFYSTNYIPIYYPCNGKTIRYNEAMVDYDVLLKKHCERLGTIYIVEPHIAECYPDRKDLACVYPPQNPRGIYFPNVR